MCSATTGAGITQLLPVAAFPTLAVVGVLTHLSSLALPTRTLSWSRLTRRLVLVLVSYRNWLDPRHLCGPLVVLPCTCAASLGSRLRLVWSSHVDPSQLVLVSLAPRLPPVARLVLSRGPVPTCPGDRKWLDHLSSGR